MFKRDASTGAPETATPAVFHSEHYNSALHRALFEVERIDAQALLERAAAEAAYQQLSEHPEWGAGAEAASRLVELFRSLGLGELNAGGISKEGGEADLVFSHLALAWRSRYGRSEKPVCAAAAGVLSGALSALYGRRYEVRETQCAARGAERCRFRVKAVEGEVDLYPEVLYPTPPSLLAPEFAPPPIPEEAVLEAVFGDALHPEADGASYLASASLTRLWADYYTRVSYRFEQQIPRVLGAKFSNLASIVLTEAGHACGFHTFGGLLVSDTWEQRVRPLLGGREEWAHALVTVINALGWGTWSIQALVPGERLTVRVYDSYEAAGFRRHMGRASAPKCYLARGVSAALMNLLYVGDMGSRPALTPSLYNDLFRSPLSFRALETRCRAMDDPFCEFVVNPLSPSLGKLLGGR